MNIKNKYVVLIGALMAQITIGGLYAWSIMSGALTGLGWNPDQVYYPYALAQFVFAASTLLSGRLVDKKGPRIAIIIGGVLYGGGLILSSFATSPTMLYLTYGVISGAGVGFVYVCPLSTLIKWFPKNKGMITGLGVSLFAGGSILTKKIMTTLLAVPNGAEMQLADVSSAFVQLGLISMVVIIIGGLLTNNPEGFVKQAATRGEGDFTTAEMVKTSKFKYTWVMFWLAVTPGLLLLGAAKNIGINAGLDAETAAGIITVLALANAGSRLASGTLSDKLGTLNVLRMAFVITIVSLLGLSFMASVKAVFYLGVVGIAVGYGGFLALFPTFTNKEFGLFRYGSNYGVVYQAYGLAALSGIFLKKAFGSAYGTTFMVSAVAACIGLGLSFMIKERASEAARKELPKAANA